MVGLHIVRIDDRQGRREVTHLRSDRHGALDLTYSNIRSIIPQVETLEHWSNGIRGTLNRRDVWLRHNPAGPLWEIESRQAGQMSFAEYGSEQAARRVLRSLLKSGPGRWTQLSE